jgi:predicted transcriptional regulator
MQLGCKTLIAKKVGCSVRTVEYMLRALVRIKALKSDNFGKGKRYYSCGYWSKYKNKEGIIDFRVYMYMNQNIAKSLADPDKFYERKPKV